MEPIYVFVYGTLKKGKSRNYVFEHHRYLGTATVQGLDMYDLFSFPGVIKGSGSVAGEVYHIAPAVLTLLDRIESYPDFYTRDLVDAHLEDGSVVKTWVYILKDTWYAREHKKIVGEPAVWNR